MDGVSQVLRERLGVIHSEITVDHILHPRNDKSLADPDGFALLQSDCGESMKIWLKVRRGAGSGSLLTRKLEGRWHKHRQQGPRLEYLCRADRLFVLTSVSLLLLWGQRQESR